uniref:Uncharacterized protein n=1 Tax=Corethron hystrix TaxID=216773 RepID=A0A7S1BWV6_9STRA
MLEVSRWYSLPLWVKSAKLFSLLNIIASVYIQVLFRKYSFEAFSVSDSFQEKLGGDALSLVKPLGWISLVLFGLSSIFCIIFKCWTKKEAAKEVLKRNGSEEESLMGSNHSV